MITLSYHLSSNLQASINKAEILRQKILLTPLPLKSELRLKWEADIDKIYWGLSLAENPLTKKQIAALLSGQTKKKPTNPEKEIISYKKALDYIKLEWFASPREIKPDDILLIYDLALRPIFGSSLAYFKSKEADIKILLEYLQTGNDHPIIKSGVVQIHLIKASPFENGSGRIARLLSYLILAKYGFDSRNLLVLEEYYRSDLVALRQAIESVDKYQNSTLWLEYYAQGVAIQLQKALEIVKQQKFKIETSSSFWKLNARLKQILSLLENPEQKITNKEVQQQFGVSQITASRDLAKLTSLGLLFPHGKGRSVFYMRI